MFRRLVLWLQNWIFEPDDPGAGTERDGASMGLPRPETHPTPAPEGEGREPSA